MSFDIVREVLVIVHMLYRLQKVPFDFIRVTTVHVVLKSSFPLTSSPFRGLRGKKCYVLLKQAHNTFYLSTLDLILQEWQLNVLSNIQDFVRRVQERCNSNSSILSLNR